MAKKLIIVESPAKTKTLKNFLTDDYVIEASMGHVRDLPEKRLGVDVDNNFEAEYENLESRSSVLTTLRKAVKTADEVFLASDPDREGEAIAWHLQQALKLKSPKRIEFNEITRSAVVSALEKPREIDMNRVDAQQARRILDRIVGYKLSPLLWKKARRNNLSAGRVQSVAVKLVVEREREISAFVPQEYWSVTAKLTPGDEKQSFDANLRMYQGQKIELCSQEQTDKVLSDLEGAEYRISDIRKSQRKRRPSAPFITSTLQQEAARKLGYSARRTMQIAQQLYEGVELGSQGAVGLITYMRTDSTRVSAEAQEQTREYIKSTFGAQYIPKTAPIYKSKASAQDAHEAIRPTSVLRTPDEIKSYLTAEQLKLYRLVWMRFVASQMSECIMDVVSVDILANEYMFRATGSTVKFEGFVKVYTEGTDNNEKNEDDGPALPELTVQQLVQLLSLSPVQHFTEPPPRYSEATLVKALEENGIGRPSTYASILGAIVDRKYVTLAQKRFSPTALGEAVTDYLGMFFANIMDVEFTANVEKELDNVEVGDQSWRNILAAFYGPFEQKLKECEESPERVRIVPKETPYKCPNCGGKMLLREGRFGPFLGCEKYPDCTTIMKVTATGEPAPPDRPSDQVCEKCGSPMVIRYGKYGDFLACSATGCRTRRPLDSGVKVVCPKCSKGSIVRKRSKRGRYLYGCDRYPDCDFVMWNKPTGDKCPNCGALLVEKTARGQAPTIICSNAECGYEKED